MIKAMFFDLDGTLLNDHKIITPKTKAALVTCKENGIRLFTATARPPLLHKILSADDYTLSLFEGGTYHNGGCVVMGSQKKYYPIEGGVVQSIVNAVSGYDRFNIALQLEEEIHAFRFLPEPDVCAFWNLSRGEILPIAHAERAKTVKVLVFNAHLVEFIIPIDPQLVSALADICQGKAQFYLTDGGKAVQIIAREVSKLKGVKEIQNCLGLLNDEIAVFGDDVNDQEMLFGYHYSFAMGNAVESVKACAQYVTLGNNEDGIDYAIREILNLVR